MVILRICPNRIIKIDFGIIKLDLIIYCILFNINLIRYTPFPPFKKWKISIEKSMIGFKFSLLKYK